MRTAAAFLIAVSLSATAFAVDGKKAAYMGGSLQGIKEKAEGPIQTAGDAFLWTYKEGSVRIPYDHFVDLEYGQKAGHRIKTAIFLSPLALFKKARHHYVTITFKDGADQEQVGLWEFGKEIIRTDLKIMQVRSGKELHFTDEDSHKNFAK